MTVTEQDYQDLLSFVRSTVEEFINATKRTGLAREENLDDAWIDHMQQHVKRAIVLKYMPCFQTAQEVEDEVNKPLSADNQVLLEKLIATALQSIRKKRCSDEELLSLKQQELIEKLTGEPIEVFFKEVLQQAKQGTSYDQVIDHLIEHVRITLMAKYRYDKDTWEAIQKTVFSDEQKVLLTQQLQEAIIVTKKDNVH